MYNADHRSQPQALYVPMEQAPESSAAAPTPRRHAAILQTILKALSWMSEIRAMPFGGLESGSWRDERSSRDY